jgi:hypothetical protein
VYGAKRVKGRRKYARAFDGERSTFIDTPVPWRMLGSNYTVSLWVKLHSDVSDQAILFNQYGGWKGGLLLRSGRMVFHVPLRGGDQYVDYPFTRYGEFVHIAAVVDADAGSVAIYEDGVLKNTADIKRVDDPPERISFGRFRQDQVVLPMHGVLDDTALWTRSLSADEIAALQDLPRATALVDTGSYYLKRAVTSWVRDFCLGVLATADLFNPFRHWSYLSEETLPTYSLFLSNADQRYLNRHSNEAANEGWFMADNRDHRRIQLVSDEGTVSASVSLYAPSASFRQNNRDVYRVTWTNHSGTVARKVFVPIELAGFLRPFLYARLCRALDLVEPEAELALVTLNGAPHGVYSVHPYRNRSQDNWMDESVFLTKVGALPLDRDVVLSVYDEMVRAWRSALLNDTFSPLSAREIQFRLREDRHLLAETLRAEWTDAQVVDAVAHQLDVNTMLASNPAAYYVVSDLRLPAFNDAGVELSWTSSNPSIVTGKGEVHRPDGAIPVGVDMHVTISRGKAQKSVSLPFRVMPIQTKLPALMLRVAHMIRNEFRVDCQAELWENGQQVVATVPARVKLRGNNALVLPKKSYSVKFERPHPFHLDNGSAYLYLSAGYADRSLMRVPLSYDIYRSLGTDEMPRYAPYADYAELFINGHYEGVYQRLSKVDRHLVEIPAYEQGRAEYDAIYKASKAGANFKTVDFSQYEQDEPPPEEFEYSTAYEEFMKFVVSSDPEAFAQDVARYVDVDAMLDFQIFINTVVSWDAYHHNFYLVRKLQQGGGFFIVPWDCDSTFARKEEEWLSNHLLDRLMRDVPGYGEKLAERWAALRSDQLSEETLLGHCDALQAELEGYVDWDCTRWEHRSNHAETVEYIREWIKKRLIFVDGKIAEVPHAHP